MGTLFTTKRTTKIATLFFGCILSTLTTQSHANKLQHEWKADENSDASISDSVGTITGNLIGPTWTDGKTNSGLSFNGKDASVEMSESAIDTLNSFSISAWVKLDSTHEWQTIISQDGENISGFFLQKMNSGEFSLSIKTKDSGDDSAEVVRAVSTLKPEADKWYHLIGVHDKENEAISLYVNGALESSTTFKTPWSATGNTTLGRGKWNGNNVDYFAGTIDEVKLYSSALTSAEARNLYAQGNTQAVLFEENFDRDEAISWTTYGGNWTIANKRYEVKGGAGFKSIADNNTFENFEYQANIRLDESNHRGDAGLVFRANNPTVGADSFSGYYAGIQHNGDVVLGKMDNNWNELARIRTNIQTGINYQLKVTAVGNEINVYLNGKHQIKHSDPTHNSGHIGVRTYYSDASFDDISIKAASHGDYIWSEPLWEKKTSKVMTDFSNGLTPENVHPDYPRMQMTRTDWLNLNGIWQIKQKEEGENLPTNQNFSTPILVPFAVEAALSGVMEDWDHVWYRKVIEIPEDWNDQRVLLHFGAVDYEAEIFVNGFRQGAPHRGGYDSFYYDITDSLNTTGNQEVLVRVLDTTADNQAVGKQTESPYEVFYTATTGIWQTVWMEPVPDSRIVSIKMTPDIDTDTLSVKINVEGDITGLSIDAAVSSLDLPVVAVTNQAVNSEFIITIPTPTLWSPDNPFLYDLKIDLKKNSNTLDSVGSYFGMRKIEAKVDPKDGYKKMYLNGKFLFQRGVLDQGYWPDGVMTAPSDDALKYDLELTQQLGFNMNRKHIKIEPDRWYYWADKLGVLVWQDMPNRGKNIRDAGNKDAQWEKELEIMMENLHNHPSIVMWVIFNEDWAQFKEEGSKRVTDEVLLRDPSRVISQVSGWVDYGDGDVKDIHCYVGESPCAPHETDRVNVTGEFGGVTYPVGVPWGERPVSQYSTVYSAKDFHQSYNDEVQWLHSKKDTQGLSAYVYTQLTDVEVEANGFITYDRKTIKGGLTEEISKINNGIFSQPLPKFKELVKTSKFTPQTWRYTTAEPGTGWEKTVFDDSSWLVGKAGFGIPGMFNANVQTPVRSDDLWMRRNFTLDITEEQVKNLKFNLYLNQTATVYINGVKAGVYDSQKRKVSEPRNKSQKTAISRYILASISDAAKAALKIKGENTISVHTEQLQKGKPRGIHSQYSDIGIVEMIPE